MGFDALVSILAELYPTQADARRIIASARIDHRYVNFDGNALRYWHDIFVVANRQDRVFELLAAVEDEYSDNAEFMRQSRLYFRDVAQLAIIANDEWKPIEDSGAMTTAIERRMDSAEDDIRDLKKLQSEMLGEMKSLNRMLEALLTGGRSLPQPVQPSPWLLASLAAIIFLITFILYILANGGSA